MTRRTKVYILIAALTLFFVLLPWIVGKYFSPTSQRSKNAPEQKPPTISTSSGAGTTATYQVEESQGNASNK